VNRFIGISLKMKKLIPIVPLVAFLAIGISARAAIVIPSTTATFNGVPYSSDGLSITYEVTETGGLYTYSYDLATSPAEYLTSFTIGGSLNSVDTQSVFISSYGGADTSLSGVTENSVIYEWDLSSDITSADVSYTSPNAPTFATFTLNDDGVEWGSPDSIPAPAPVPEASTLLAGALMVLPFGVGAFRALRKDRRL
jgi:hypothetical protein